MMKRLKLSYTAEEVARLTPEDRKRFESGAEATFMRVDREYFELHPEATSYERLSLKGEFVMAGEYIKPGSAIVTVTQLRRGVRKRSFYFAKGVTEFDEELIREEKGEG